MNFFRLYIFFLLVSISFLSCDFLVPKKEENLIARVQDTYLYESEYLKLFPDNIAREDSLLFANQIINNWATKQILKQKAILNLDQNTQEKFNRLAEAYKLDLYTNAYLDALVTKEIDTVITAIEIDTLYKQTALNFKLNEEVLQFRYIVINKEHKELEKVKEKFLKFDNNDKIDLDSLSIQFHSYMLNDSTWVKKTQLLRRLPILKENDHIQLLKKSNFLQLEDSLRVYLVRVNNLLRRGEQAPLEYVKPTLEQIIQNKRKLELIKQLEIDIRKDALQNNEFEIYN
ncbi:peptidyl-prolyl cis-trans isomerase [Pseudofulvibacter geojedonensis]|uniref:Peptidyl-prolyl cis-trans isomerase n=1 Tax=Pseudofulvibacter geojedonensis TaxID=1123758 RepID=A0ABW3I2P3_9FLAO